MELALILNKNIIKQHIDGDWTIGDVVSVPYFCEYWIYTKQGWVEISWWDGEKPKETIYAYEIMDRIRNKRHSKNINRYRKKR
jgi:hypothetical protein